jgi:outer membrane protein assembly factor BamB
MRSLILFASVVLIAHSAEAVDVLTSRNNIARTGVNADERVLTPARINAGTFGKLWTLYADGQIVAQPLYVAKLKVDTSTNPNAPRVQGTFNAVLIATMHNTIYLYDADRERPGPHGQNVPLWATWLGQPRPGGGEIDMWATNDPEWGILSTPVIDPTKSIVYVVAWHDDGGHDNYKYRLHALRLKDGTHVAPPVVLQGEGLSSKLQKQRAGLLLSQGIVYIGLGGDGNKGLLLAYDAKTLTKKAQWASTPTGHDGGIWQAGQAPTADTDGNVYLMTGNGTADGQHGNYGQSFVKLRLEGNAIKVKDYFTPCNAKHMNSIDGDLGSSGPVLIPGTDLVFGAGKEGLLYLLSRGKMGKHAAPQDPHAHHCPNPNTLQEVHATKGHPHSHVHGSPVFWEGTDGARIYVWGEHDRLRAYPFVNRRVVPHPKMNQHHLPQGMPGGMLSLSSNGKNNGILWAIVPLDGDANAFRGVKGLVLALDAKDVSKALWTSEQSGARDRLGLFAKFVPPTVASGKVFVATYGDDEAIKQYGGGARPHIFPKRYQVAVYGMLAEQPAPIVDQSRDDVQLVRATVEDSPAIDTQNCRPSAAQTLDCTDELQRVADAPSLERITVPAGSTLAGCQLLRVTTAAKTAALPAALGIGFYAAATTLGQVSNNIGRLVQKNDLKSVGSAMLKSGEPATLHEFAALVNCEVTPGTNAAKQLKPHIDFVGGPPRTVFRNWDPVAGNYAIGGPIDELAREAEVLR